MSERPATLDHATAERLRDMLTAAQLMILQRAPAEDIVNYISREGFRLVDELEDVDR